VQIAIFGNRSSWYVDDLGRAAAARGHGWERLDFQRLQGWVGSPGDSVGDSDTRLEHADAVLVRTMPRGSLEQVVFRMDALARLEHAGTVVINPPKSIECAVDKYLATARLRAAGLPVPETIVCERAEDAFEAFEQLGGDVVVKPLFGSEGRGIVRVSQTELAWRTFRTLEQIDAVLYLQRFVDHGGCDDRVLVLDGEAIGGMRRHSRDDFRTNISQHGRGEAWTPSSEDVALARSAAEATGAVLAGVDLVTGPGGERYVLEVNAVPGWRALARVTDVDVADRIVAWIEIAVRAPRPEPATDADQGQAS